MEKKICKSYLPEYVIWQAIKTRCYNKNHQSYNRYGGRGIIVCNEWLHSFDVFLRDMGSRPFKGAQIDRLDNNKGYSKYNCTWTTCLQNIRNSTVAKLDIYKVREIRHKYRYPGSTYLSLSEMYNVSLSTICKILTNQTWEDSFYERNLSA